MKNPYVLLEVGVHCTYAAGKKVEKDIMAQSFAFNRRVLLGPVASLAAMPRAFAQAGGPFTLPPLGYGFDALEPHIERSFPDPGTMKRKVSDV